MTLYILLFILIVCNYLYESQGNSNSKKKHFFVFLIIGLFVGLGDMLGGYDRYIYGALFDHLADTRNSGGNMVTDTTIFVLYGKELGYVYYNVLLTFITSNRYIFILLTSLVIYFNVYLSIKKYSTNYALSTIVFMGLMFFFTFTYLRQVIAASFIWVAFQAYIDRKPYVFFAILALAVSFHNSAIIAAPLYFVPIKKYPSKTVLAALGMCLIVGLSPIPSSLFDAYGESVSELRGNQYVENITGFRIAYFLEAALFVWFILKNYEVVDSKDKRLVAFTNIALIFCCILLIFVKSENGGRLSWYFLVGPIMSFTYICTLSPKRAVNTTFVIVLSTLLYLRILFAWSFNMCPYKTFLTPGHTAAEWIYEEYEYDTYYDIDKFYR